MRRRPHEDDEEQHEAVQRHGAGDDAVADGGGQRPRGAADHDVLRRRALEPHRVDQRVEHDGEAEQRRRQPVAGQRHHQDGEDRQHPAERVGFARGDAARRDRAAAGAPHHGVDVGLVGHVERARGARSHRRGEQAHEGHHRVDVARRHHDTRRRGEDHQRHHPRLQQLPIIARQGEGTGEDVLTSGRFSQHRHAFGSVRFGTLRAGDASAGVNWPPTRAIS